VLVVVTLGPDGALAFAPDQALYARAPRIRAVNATGCGDVFLAGLVAGRLRGCGLAEQLRLATAAAAANAARLEPGIGAPAAVAEGAAGVVVAALTQDVEAAVWNRPLQ